MLKVNYVVFKKKKTNCGLEFCLLNTFIFFNLRGILLFFLLSLEFSSFVLVENKF